MLSNTINIYLEQSFYSFNYRLRTVKAPEIKFKKKAHLIELEPPLGA